MVTLFPSELQARIAELQAIFHQQLPAKINDIKGRWQHLGVHWEPEQVIQLHHLCHTLAGNGGTFGAHKVSQLARQIEQRLKALAADNSAPATERLHQLDVQVEQLCKASAEWTPPLRSRSGSQVAGDVSRPVASVDSLPTREQALSKPCESTQ